MRFWFSFRKDTFATCREGLLIVFPSFLKLPFTIRLIFKGDLFFKLRSLDFPEFIVWSVLLFPTDFNAFNFDVQAQFGTIVMFSKEVCSIFIFPFRAWYFDLRDHRWFIVFGNWSSWFTLSNEFSCCDCCMILSRWGVRISFCGIPQWFVRLILDPWKFTKLNWARLKCTLLHPISLNSAKTYLSIE